MKKLLTLILTLFLFSSVYAEARVVDKLEYRDGVAYAVGEGEGFSGTYITKHSNGSKESEVNYIDGKRDGLTTKWFNNGNKSSEYLFKLGQRATITKVNNNIYVIVSQEIYNFGNNVNLNHLDTSEVTDMSGLFEYSRFNGDISKWDVSKVTDMSLMFYGSKFNGNISKWDVSNVTDMKKMFSGYLFPYKKGPKPQKIRQSRFNGDISKWDVSNVTDMSGIFKYSKFNGDISKWNISNVANTGLTLYGSKFTGDRLKRSMTLIEAEGDGIVIEEIEIRGGIAYAIGEGEGFSGKLATTYSNGKNKLKVNYINGLKDGTSHSWYYSGKLKKTTNYVKGKKIGLDQYYYPDGSKWDSAFYDKNGDLLFEETVETGPNSKWITQNFYEDKKRFKRRVLSSKRWKKKVIFYNLGKNADRSKVIKIDRYPTKELVKRKGLEYMVDYESDIPYTGRYVKLKDKSLALKSIKKPCETDPNIEEGIEYEFGVRDGNAFSCNEDGSSINYKYVFGKKYSEEEYKGLGSQLIYNKNLKQFHEYNNFYKKKETAVEENILKEKENGIASSLRVVNNIAYIPNDSEPFTGKYIRKYSNGKKEIESTYKIGKQEGKETWWYKNGKKGRESRYKNNQLDGLEIEWDGGSVVSTINWHKGKKHGLETWWHPNGEKLSEVNYINGTRQEENHFDGTRQEKDPFEGIKRLKDPWSKDIVTITKKTRKIPETSVVNKLEYKNGIAYAVGESEGFSGIYITKHSNGENKLKVNYMDGLKDGPSTSWHYNRQKKSLVYYKKNKKEGFETRWHYEGQRSEETNYAHGIKNGLSTEWYENGKKYRETNFVNGKGNRTQWDILGKKRFESYVDSSGHIIGIDKNKSSKSSKKSTGVTSLFIGPDSMKTTVYRGGDVAEQTETIFVDRNHRVKGEKELREKWRAKWKAAWKEGRTIDDLEKEEFILNPDLERRFSKYRDDALELFYSDNKKDREEAVVILRKLAFAGSTPAYYDLIFMSHDSSYEEDMKLQIYKLFGNMFEYSFMERPKTEVSNEMIILAKDNPNNNTDQNELIRRLLLLSQKKFQHYNHLINIAGADMFLSYMILSMPGSQSDAKTEYYLAARFDRNEIGEIADYLLTNEEIARNLEKEAEEGDVLSMMFLVNMHNPKDMYKTLKQIVPQNAEKAIYYSKKIIEHIKVHKDDVDIKKSPSLARKAYETLRELKDESMLKEVNLYFKDIDDAKSKREQEISARGKFCTVSFMEGDKPKRKTYRYYKTKDCLDHIKHADENGYLNKGQFKNGNNPLIFWGPQGTYEGTKSLMKNHKPLNK